jgi:dihydrofolate reductase
VAEAAPVAFAAHSCEEGMMGKLRFDLSVSLDGFVAGPNPSLEDPLGVGGEKLHDWAVATAAFRERHGGAGGETGVDSDVRAEIARSTGATVVGRRMFSGGQGPWEDDPNPNASWWGDDPPFHHPVFVLTHHAREPVTMKGGTTYTFVTTGIQDALEQARAGAGDKDVVIGGGADVAQQYLRAGLVDEFQLHVVPVFLGQGTRLLEGLPDFTKLQIERTQVLASPTGVIHARYRVLKRAA